jgi:ribosomal protein S6/ribosomal protein S18
LARKSLRSFYKGEKRNYEMCLIMTQKLSEDALKSKLGEVKSRVEEFNGEVIETVNTKVRTFEYPINTKSNTKGYYACLYFKLKPSEINPLKAKLSLEDSILRVLIVLADPKKQSYGMFSANYEDDAVRKNSQNVSYDDPNALLAYAGEAWKIVPTKRSQGSKISGGASKKQRKISKLIKTARSMALFPYKDSLTKNS